MFFFLLFLVAFRPRAVTGGVVGGGVGGRWGGKLRPQQEKRSFPWLFFSTEAGLGTGYHRPCLFAGYQKTAVKRFETGVCSGTHWKYLPIPVVICTSELLWLFWCSGTTGHLMDMLPVHEAHDIRNLTSVYGQLVFCSFTAVAMCCFRLFLPIIGWGTVMEQDVSSFLFFPVEKVRKAVYGCVFLW